MRWIKSIARGIYGLFVDDGSFAIAIVVWLVFCVVVIPHMAVGTWWAGPVLFAGLAAILIESVLRFARRHTH
jgi:hypothetical protein